MSKNTVKVYSWKKVVGLIWRTSEVALLGLEFGVVGSSSTHAVEEADMETMRLYQCCIQISLVVGYGKLGASNNQ